MSAVASFCERRGIEDEEDEEEDKEKEEEGSRFKAFAVYVEEWSVLAVR